MSTIFSDKLKEVLRLYQTYRHYNTQFFRFDYDLREENDELILEIYFPDRSENNTVGIFEDGTIDGDYDAKVEEIRGWMESRMSHSHYFPLAGSSGQS